MTAPLNKLTIHHRRHTHQQKHNNNNNNNVWLIRSIKVEVKSKAVLGVDLFHPSIMLKILRQDTKN
jgi:hypothetical protein